LDIPHASVTAFHPLGERPFVVCAL